MVGLGPTLPLFRGRELTLSVIQVTLCCMFSGSSPFTEPEATLIMSDLQILCEHRPSSMKLEIQGVYDWPIWNKEVSTFEWEYTQTEICYILRGKFIVTPEGGEPQEFGRGDLITFPAGMKCTWEILKDVEKHYTFE